MNGEKRLIVGVDICEDYLQLAYFDEKTLNAVSICRENDEEAYLIETRLAMGLEGKKWLIGDEIQKAVKEGEKVIEVDDFYLAISDGNSVSISDETYTAKELMEAFIKRVLFVLNSFYPYEEIVFIAFTFEKITKSMVSVMEEALKALKMDDRYALLDHDEAFLYHTLHQNKEQRLNDTAIFELDEEKMAFSILQIKEDEFPMVAKISERYVSKDLTKGLVDENKEEAERIFENLSLMALEKRFVSNVYAVGRGFLTSWADNVLRKLAPGRRVYRGQNLFVRGACFLARDRAIGREENVVFLGMDRISAGVSIMAFKDGKEREIVLVKPSLKWYEADVTEDIIIRGEDELCIQIKDFITKKITRKFLSLSGINLTGNDISRIRLRIKFKDKDSCVIKAVDLGFGSFVPTTNRVWELTWEK